MRTTTIREKEPFTVEPDLVTDDVTSTPMNAGTSEGGDVLAPPADVNVTPHDRDGLDVGSDEIAGANP